MERALVAPSQWDGARDAYQEADDAADPSANDVALRRWGQRRAIARELGIGHSTVCEYLARITAAGITWPLPAEMTDADLEQRLFVHGGVQVGARYRAEPDWAQPPLQSTSFAG